MTLRKSYKCIPTIVTKPGQQENSKEPTDNLTGLCSPNLSNKIRHSVAFHIKTSQLFCSTKQLTGFYMEHNIGLKWVTIAIFHGYLSAHLFHTFISIFSLVIRKYH